MSRYSCRPAQLSELLASVRSEYTATNDHVMVSGISQDSRSLTTGDVYCCVRGETFNGTEFIADALAAGAVAVVVDTDVSGIPDHIAVVTVPNVREFLGPFASSCFGHPSHSLRMVGVTGTNGKTSTTSMIASILQADGIATQTVGTLSGERTTPEAIDLHAALRTWVDDGVSAVVMEVSSHALVQHRVDGIMFEVAVFTNIGRDHLDFHKTEEAYFAAKARLFSPELSRQGVVNIDDPKGSFKNGFFVEMNRSRFVGGGGSKESKLCNGCNLRAEMQFGKRWDWVRLVRTEMKHASYIAQMEQNKATGVPFVRWSASRAGATCPICQALNGRVFRLNGSTDMIYNPDLVDLTSEKLDTCPPPAHPQCRCVQIPVWGKPKVQAPRPRLERITGT